MEVEIEMLNDISNVRASEREILQITNNRPVKGGIIDRHPWRREELSFCVHTVGDRAARDHTSMVKNVMSELSLIEE